MVGVELPKQLQKADRPMAGKTPVSRSQETDQRRHAEALGGEEEENGLGSRNNHPPNVGEHAV
jgi:hypothetical protein